MVALVRTSDNKEQNLPLQISVFGMRFSASFLFGLLVFERLICSLVFFLSRPLRHFIFVTSLFLPP